MSADREELRRLWHHVLIDQRSELAKLTTGIPAALDDLDAKDRLIAHLQQIAAERYEEAEELHAAMGDATQGARPTIAGMRGRIKELEAELLPYRVRRVVSELRDCLVELRGKTTWDEVTGDDIDSIIGWGPPKGDERWALCKLHDLVNQTDPNDPIGVALTKAGLERRLLPSEET